MLIARDLDTAEKHAPTVQELYLHRLDLFEVPEVVFRMPKLRLLDLTGNPIQALPDTLAQLQQLSTLILKRTQLPVVPTVISKLENLEKLVLDGNAIPYLPVELAALKKLKALHFSENQLRTWPDELSQLPALSSLILDHNQLSALPESIAQLQQLSYIDLRHNPLHNFPRGLGAISQLEFVLLENHPFPGPAETNLLEIITRFFRQTFQQALAPKTRLRFLDLLLTNVSQLADLPRAEALRLLNANYPDVQRKAPDALHQALPSPFGEEKTKQICLLGSFRHLRRSWVQKELRALDIQLTNHPTGPATTVICGERPGHKLDKALSAHQPTGVEGHLADFLRQQKGEYLAQGPSSDPGMLANLQSLLESGARENIELALMLMEGGGLPRSMLSEVLALQLFFPESEVRQRAEALLNRTLPRGLQQYITRCQQSATLAPNQVDLDQLLRSLSKNARIAPVPLARAALQQGRGIGYVLDLPPDAQAKLWPYALRGQQLNLARQALAKLPETITGLSELKHLLLNNNHLTKLPRSIQALKKLEGLHLANNRLTALPKELSSLRSLQQLDLRGNRLTSLPDEISKLANLKGLRLDLNPLEALPATIGEFHSLELLSLHGGLSGIFPQMILHIGSLVSLDIGDCKISALPPHPGQISKLQALNLPRNPIEQLPDWVGELPHLRYLDLSYCGIRELPETLADSKTLERIYLLQDDSMNWEQVAEVLRQIPSLRGLNLKHNRISPNMQKHLEQILDQGRKKIYYGN